MVGKNETESSRLTAGMCSETSEAPPEGCRGRAKASAGPVQSTLDLSEEDKGLYTLEKKEFTSPRGTFKKARGGVREGKVFFREDASSEV